MLIIVLAVIIVGLFGIFWFVKRPMLVAAVDENYLPKFIQADFIDLDKIASISKFRSASGHDFSSHGETCRSMKHYFSPPAKSGYPLDKNGQLVLPPPPDPATAIPIYSPVDGWIISISEEHTPIGKQFSIRPSSDSNYNIRLFHVYPENGIHAGSKVKAGQRIGSIGENQGTDIAVEVTTLKGPQFVSYFQVMPDTVFANYQKHGIANRQTVIISQAERDANPLQCTGDRDEQFAENYQSNPNYDGEVYLSGYSRESYNMGPKDKRMYPGSSSEGQPSDSTQNLDKNQLQQYWNNTYFDYSLFFAQGSLAQFGIP